MDKGKTYYTKPWYGSWHSMMDRCYNPNVHNYPMYGGRGITVCDEWHDIQMFEKWVEKSGYEKGLTLDRIDVNAGYYPQNCRWSTMKEQANNRRNTIFVTWNGEKHSLSEWSDILGINKSTLANRYWRGDRGDRLFEKVRYNRCHA